MKQKNVYRNQEKTFGLSNSLRIRGYFIKYSRIFHHVSTDISLRIRGYASFLLCPRDLLVVRFRFFSYGLA